VTEKPKRISTAELHEAITKSLELRSLIKAGRGNLGGTSSLSPLAKRAIFHGRPLLLGDGDGRNPGISLFKEIYETHGLLCPSNEEAGHLKEWLL